MHTGRFLALALTLGLLSVASVQGASAAGRPSCLVSNERTGLGARSLQAAIDAAVSGDTLVIKGTCYGTSLIGGEEGSITDKDLTLRGVANNQFGTPTLDGQASSDPVLTISSYFGNTVSISDLTIRNGSSEGVFLSDSQLTLTRSTVSGNGGLGLSTNYSGVTLVDSTVSGNAGGISGTR